MRDIGVKPRQSRNTALFTLAAEIPSAILAKMLGLHIAVAIQWQRASAGDWMAYAADVAGRAATDGQAETPKTSSTGSSSQV
ncbi:hypothetical protein [Streptomyces sp. CBMA123]|uniref:hypothetical protein n=1 Tax=Streptomyces sp. CBMA123 TaxID=1896313 RepID=UPI00166213AC|nr:hypothetical protein [Streptomyces sp. CBMA123]